ncbi:MAG: ATP-binding protein [Candidatus Aminicenantes bacterium]|nr:ATP-binding protein [Candidatus Aminicenantes bacterium]
MLVEFRVGNFRSFKDEVTLSMVASADKEHLATHTVKISNKLSLLRSAAIYGANASGKSNLFNAMAFMRNFVLNSSRESQATEKIDVEKFRLSTETENRPSTFEIVFLMENIRYRYGFQVDEKQVHNEWLFYVPTIREATLFIREKSDIKVGPDFKEGKGLEAKTRENALFLSVAAQFNGEKAKKILEWFDHLSIISSIDANRHREFTLSKLADKEYEEFTSKFLRVADLGIKEIQKTERPLIEEDLSKDIPLKLKSRIMSAVVDVEAVHQKYDQHNKPVVDEKFSLFKNESAGTLALFGLSGPIYDTIKKGKVLVIDELTSKLHPLLTQAIIEAFHQSHYETGSDRALPSQAQLIFVSHDTGILKNQLFRRDQIWFTQKNEYGATNLYSLEEYSIRKDASFDKDYIMGKYGAVPFIGGIESLFSSL